MAIKKSELYSSIWEACDKLRGGMDASEYKNYILVLLFIKYVSDKYAGDPYATIQIPPGSSFADLRALKGNPDIGDLINKKIVGPLFEKNGLSDAPDFNSSEKLGEGKEKVDRLTDLIAIFEDKNLDFSANRADGDDLLGDAYEYLMRHFATESGKSKGQFYTPTEVSLTIAQIIGIANPSAAPQTTIYDPTCGSGSLLLRVADAAKAAKKTNVKVFGQEKDSTTSGLTRMNMILHKQESYEIRQGNTLAAPAFTSDNKLERFDYVVANPPFSDKSWSTGVNVDADQYERFIYGTPPAKQGDYAYLLHILASLKSTGTGVCVLPHGVLFRGNAEAAIRENLVKQGFILGIIGLPANLFFGTGIPACLVVIDKAGAKDRKGIFMVDASSGFMKDGPKNRLRTRDIHKIVDAFTRKADIPGYSRLVPVSEIEANEFNLNLPRYIDSQEKEDIQDIDGHLNGGIPVRDIDALDSYWKVCPSLRKVLFKKSRDGYVDLAVDKTEIKSTIQDHPEFQDFIKAANGHFEAWQKKVVPTLKALEPGFHPKNLAKESSEDLLQQFLDNPLIDGYAVYQHLMDYWETTMQDDCYIIAADGWNAEVQRVIETTKNGKTKDKGWLCELIPKEYVVRRYFAREQGQIDDLTAKFEAVTVSIEELEEEHSSDDDALNIDPLNVASVKKQLKAIENNKDFKDEALILKSWLELTAQASELKKVIKDADKALDDAALAKYPELTQDEIKSLVVDDKWMGAIAASVSREVDLVGQLLTGRIGILEERYAVPLPSTSKLCASYEISAIGDLEKMGFSRG